MIGLRPGTVLVTRSGGFAGTMIRFGAALRGKPNLQNHVAVAHHTDVHGTLWCIEGRPDRLPEVPVDVDEHQPAVHRDTRRGYRSADGSSAGYRVRLGFNRR